MRWLDNNWSFLVVQAISHLSAKCACINKSLCEKVVTATKSGCFGKIWSWNRIHKKAYWSTKLICFVNVIYLWQPLTLVLGTVCSIAMFQPSNAWLWVMKTAVVSDPMICVLLKQCCGKKDAFQRNLLRLFASPFSSPFNILIPSKE